MVNIFIYNSRLLSKLVWSLTKINKFLFNKNKQSKQKIYIYSIILLSHQINVIHVIITKGWGKKFIHCLHHFF
jgi:hypothetical protein